MTVMKTSLILVAVIVAFVVVISCSAAPTTIPANVKRHCNNKLHNIESIDEFGQFVDDLLAFNQHIGEEDIKKFDSSVRRCLIELDSLFELNEILRSIGNDACSPHVIDRIESFDDVYIRPSRSYFDRLELSTITFDGPAGRLTKLAQPTPSQLKHATSTGYLVAISLFEKIALRISATCRSNLIDNIEMIAEPSFTAQEYNQVLGHFFPSSQNHEISAVDRKRSAELDILKAESMSDLLIGEHRMYYEPSQTILQSLRQMSYGSSNQTTTSVDNNNDQNVSSGQPMFVSAKSTQIVSEIREACRKFEPVYDPLIVSSVRLAKRGYLAKAINYDRQVEESHEASLLARKWFTLTQVCDLMLRMNLQQMSEDGNSGRFETPVERNSGKFADGVYKVQVNLVEEPIDPRVTTKNPTQLLTPVTMDNRLPKNLYDRNDKDELNRYKSVWRRFLWRVAKFGNLIKALWNGRARLNLTAAEKYLQQSDDENSGLEAARLVEQVDTNLLNAMGDSISQAPFKRPSRRLDKDDSSSAMVMLSLKRLCWVLLYIMAILGLFSFISG